MRRPPAYALQGRSRPVWRSFCGRGVGRQLVVDQDLVICGIMEADSCCQRRPFTTLRRTSVSIFTRGAHHSGDVRSDQFIPSFSLQVLLHAGGESSASGPNSDPS